MLALTRKSNESVVIDNGRITLHVLRVDRGKVVLGFECDRSIPVDRSEIHALKAATGRATPLPAAA
jgi:carbon storage regulator CsrA